MTKTETQSPWHAFEWRTSRGWERLRWYKSETAALRAIRSVTDQGVYRIRHDSGRIVGTRG
jgi:hypothetical protein